MLIKDGNLCSMTSTRYVDEATNDVYEYFYVDIGRVSIHCNKEFAALEIFKAIENYGTEVTESD